MNDFLDKTTLNTVLQGEGNAPLSAPFPESTLRLDEICTELTPVFSWRNSDGGTRPVKYTLQVDTCAKFNSENLIEMRDIPEGIYTTAVTLDKYLIDRTQWFYRIMATDATGTQSDWSTECGGVTNRFFVSTKENRVHEYLRLPILDVSTSCGCGKENIVDYDDKSVSYWEGMEGLKEHWVEVDLGAEKTISRIFILSGSAGWKAALPENRGWNDSQNLDGRLKNYIWQYSSKGTTWTDVEASKCEDADAFRRIIDLPETITARFLRLLIEEWHGQTPRVYGIMLYSKEQPTVPEVPENDYVLVISNIVGFKPEKGKVKTDFGQMIRGEGGHIAPPWNLDVLEIPAHAFSVESFSKVKKPPIAIFLSGSPNTFCQLPMFEFNGEFELVRTSKIPIWGSCAGVQIMVMAYGSTYSRNTGRSYRTYTVKDIIDQDIPTIQVQNNDPIFAGMNNPFYGPELHTWMAHTIPSGWSVLATSQDTQGFICTEMIRDPPRLLYGSQFHPEIVQPFSCSKVLILNFLHMAIENKNSQHTNTCDLSVANYTLRK